MSKSATPGISPARQTLLLTLLLAGAPFSAHADCRSLPYEYSPLQNDKRTALVYCDASGGRMSLRNGLNPITAANIEFTSAKVVQHPRAGRLQDADGFSFFYTPRTGPGTRDSFVIRICGKGGSGQGCSTITYQVTVQ